MLTRDLFAATNLLLIHPTARPPVANTRVTDRTDNNTLRR